MSNHIAVIGGGISGLTTSVELARCGYEVVLFEKHPMLGSGSSTGNHGWLHSGAFFLVQHGPEVVNRCVEGARKIKEMAPECVELGRGGFLVTSDEFQADRFREACREADFYARQISGSELSILVPELDTSSIYIFAVPDCSFRPQAAMKGYVDAALKADVRIICNAEVQRLHLHGKRVTSLHLQSHSSGEFFDVSVDFVINAAGPACPAVVALADVACPELRVFESTLLVVRPALINCLVLSLDRLGVTLVPHGNRTVIGVNGDSVPVDKNQPSRKPTSIARIEPLLAATRSLLPSFEQSVYDAWAWTCRKIEWSHRSDGRSPAYAVLDHGLDNFLTCIPGKFTIAPVMAEAVVKEVSERVVHARRIAS